MQLFVHLRFVLHSSANLGSQRITVTRSQPSDVAAQSRGYQAQPRGQFLVSGQWIGAASKVDFQFLEELLFTLPAIDYG